MTGLGRRLRATGPVERLEPPAGTGASVVRAAADPGRRPVSLRVAVPSLALVLVLTAGVAISIGSVSIDLGTVAAIVWRNLIGGVQHHDAVQDHIVWSLRVPRVLLAALVGGGLALVGVALQAIVRNPLADPYVLGISAGAGLLASLAIALGSAAVAGLSASAAAFVGALAATVAVLGASRRDGRLTPGRLVLAGVTLSYLFTGATSFVIFSSDDPNAAESVLFWMLGSLGQASWSNLAVPAAVVLAGGIYLLRQARTLNAMVHGDDVALSLGVAVDRARIRLLAVASVVTGVLVAVAGGIAFVGLIVPHLVRLVVGPDHRRLMPLAVLTGAIYLVAVDVVCRTAVRPEELPVGIVTSVLGAPLLLWLLRRTEGAR